MLTLKNYLERTITSLEANDIKHISSIKNYAFSSSNSLTSVVIPNNITSIGIGAFQKCTNLSSITFNCPNCVVEGSAHLDTGAFEQNTTVIPSVTINVKSIGGRMFYSSRITNVIIPDSVESIGDSAFGGSMAFSVVDIGQNVATIGSKAFSGSASGRKYYFRQPLGMSVSLPTAGSSDGLFYDKTSHTATIYTDNLTIKNYAYATDNCTATIYHLDGSPWE